MNEFFDITEEEKVEEEKPKGRGIDFFAYLKDILYGKNGNIHKDLDPDLKKFNTFMILRYLSLEPKYCELANIINQYQSCLNNEEMYKLLLFLVPRENKFLQYPKLVKNGINEDELKLIKTYFECSMEEVKEWINLKILSTYDVQKIVDAFGGKVVKKKEKKKKVNVEEDIDE